MVAVVLEVDNFSFTIWDPCVAPALENRGRWSGKSIPGQAVQGWAQGAPGMGLGWQQAQEANCCWGPGRTGHFSIHISLPPLSLTSRAAALMSAFAAEWGWSCWSLRVGGWALLPLPWRWHSILTCIPFCWSWWQLPLSPAPWEPGTLMGLLSGPQGNCEGPWFPFHPQIHYGKPTTSFPQWNN